jgi:hypothetical protein
MSVATERIKEERKQCEEDITKFEDKLRNEYKRRERLCDEACVSFHEIKNYIGECCEEKYPTVVHKQLQPSFMIDALIVTSSIWGAVSITETLYKYQ